MVNDKDIGLVDRLAETLEPLGFSKERISSAFVSLYETTRNDIFPMLVKDSRIVPIYSFMNGQRRFSGGNGLYFGGSVIPGGELFYICDGKHWSVPATPENVQRAYQFFGFEGIDQETALVVATLELYGQRAKLEVAK
jgi:hypothetical protein